VRGHGEGDVKEGDGLVVPAGDDREVEGAEVPRHAHVRLEELHEGEVVGSVV